MKKVIYGLVGASGFGSEVMPLLQESVKRENRNNVKEEFYFVDSNKDINELNSVKVINEESFFSLDHDELHFNVAIADSAIREKISNKFIKKGCNVYSICSDSTKILHNCEISPGSILTDNTILTSNLSIGKFFHCNIYSYVAHGCVVGDFVTLAPGVMLNGNVRVEDHAYIGTGAIIKQGTPQNPLVIGKGAVVGMGAVVTKDVEPYTTVIGNPARLFKK